MESYYIWNTNHGKSSGAMKGAGAVEIFRRSIDNYGLVYNILDTLSFKEAVDSQPYDHIGIVRAKLECARPVQKRLGTRL